VSWQDISIYDFLDKAILFLETLVPMLKKAQDTQDLDLSGIRAFRENIEKHVIEKEKNRNDHHKKLHAYLNPLREILFTCEEIERSLQE